MPNLLNHTIDEMDKRCHFHPVTSIADHQTHGSLVVSEANGVYVKDSRGVERLDMGAGLWCVNVGYGQDVLAETAASAMRKLSYQHSFGAATCEMTARLSDRLLTLFRETTNVPEMARVFFGVSGSDANDTALKLAIYYNNMLGRTEKKKIISRIGGYHGVTYGSGSLTGIAAYHKAFDQPIANVLHTSCPHYYHFKVGDETENEFTERLIRDLQDLIKREGADTIAAFIAEPVMGTGGVFIPPQGYFEKLQGVLREHDILLIADEVITGFGRTGQWFGSGTYQLRPDIVSLAKGMTSAYFPMSASLISTRVWDVLEQTSSTAGVFMHGFTYSGHPVGSAVAMANINLIEQYGLVENARRLGPVLLDRMKARIGDNPFVGDVRGVGLMLGVEFVADKAARTPFPPTSAPQKVVAKLAMKNGLLTRALPFLAVNSFSPPLCITQEQIDEAVERYATALDQAMPQLKSLC